MPAIENYMIENSKMEIQNFLQNVHKSKPQVETVQLRRKGEKKRDRFVEEVEEEKLIEWGNKLLPETRNGFSAFVWKILKEKF